MIPRSGGRWFLVLPDHEAAPAVAERVTRFACQALPHASGRPWLVGCWDEREVATAATGATRLAVAGAPSLTSRELAVRAPVVRSAQGAQAVVAGVAGSFHLLASVDGRVYARGSNSGARRLYAADVDGVRVAADRARTLAFLTGAAPDPARLAAGLATPYLPHPLTHAAMWRAVTAVPPGEALRLEPDGSATTERWWQAPPSDLPLERAASLLRQRLRDAVAARVRPGEVWGADLSGGLDSTSLCFLAAEAGAQLVAVTMEWSAAGNEDVRYAGLAASHLPGMTHLLFPTATLPGHFTGIDQRREPGDAPVALLRDRAQQDVLVRRLREHGAARRFCGHGGDHVVTPPASYLHRLVRRRPFTGLRHALAYRALLRWPLSATAHELLSPRPLASWLARQAGRLPVTSREQRPACGWAPPLSLPPWATPQARELLAKLLRQAAEDDASRPWAPDRGTHAWIQAARLAGIGAAHLTSWADNAGLPFEMPFCDDAVIDAALRARPHEAGHPATYKPLLTTAMRGVLPEPNLARTTKDHSGQEWYAGLAAQRRTLAAWAEDSRLAAYGLAEPGALRRCLLTPGLLSGGADELENTLSTEAWLRDLEATPHPDHLREHSHEPDTTQAAAAS